MSAQATRPRVLSTRALSPAIAAALDQRFALRIAPAPLTEVIAQALRDFDPHAVIARDDLLEKFPNLCIITLPSEMSISNYTPEAVRYMCSKNINFGMPVTAWQTCAPVFKEFCQNLQLDSNLETILFQNVVLKEFFSK